jgi:methylenetetrahydrofolate dehydrogenase (NADP+)/methenyltetrahydrofolate cyclohydrolase
VLVGENPSSRIYIENKQKACEKLGIASNLYEFPESMKEEKLEALIKQLNDDKRVHGIIVQLPLPKHIDEKKILNMISPKKDVDGLNAVNIGNLLLGDETIAPCTPKGIIRMLEKMKIQVEKRNVVIVNNSIVVGKPLAMMLTNRFATVTLCHVKTKFLKEHTKKAEILITATGVPNLIKKDMVREGAVVIDAGICYREGKVYGDVDFENVKSIASFITPVPGGVGPMTVAMVLENTLILAENKV